MVTKLPYKVTTPEKELVMRANTLLEAQTWFAEHLPAEPQYWRIIHTREESWTFIGDTWTVDKQVLEAGLML